jgi:hypothetical protein
MAEKAGLDTRALDVLKDMGKHLSAQEKLHFVFEDTIEKMDEDGDILTFTHRREAWVQRPSMFRVDVSGDLEVRGFYYDGKSFTMTLPEDEVRTGIEHVGTVDSVLQALAETYGVHKPASNFMRSDSLDTALDRLVSAKYVGESMVEGVACHHLFFSNGHFGWQLWVRREGDPLPVKAQIVYTGLPGEPRYTLWFRTIETSFDVSAAHFDPPAAAAEFEQVEMIPMMGKLAGEEK